MEIGSSNASMHRAVYSVPKCHVLYKTLVIDGNTGITHVAATHTLHVFMFVFCAVAAWCAARAALGDQQSGVFVVHDHYCPCYQSIYLRLDCGIR